MLSLLSTQEKTVNYEDIAKQFENLPAADAEAIDAASSREGNLTKPAGSLGRLEELSAVCLVCGLAGSSPRSARQGADTGFRREPRYHRSGRVSVSVGGH